MSGPRGIVERNAQQLREARNTMAKLVNSGQVRALDRMGVPIAKGDLVIVRLNPDPIFQVIDVKPPLDPRQRLDTVTVIIAVTIPLTVQAGVPNTHMLVYGSILSEDAPSSDLMTDPDPQPAGPPAGAE